MAGNTGWQAIPAKKPMCDRLRDEVGNPAEPEKSRPRRMVPPTAEASRQDQIARASNGGRRGEAAGENRSNGQIRAGHDKIIGADGGKADHRGRESDKASGGRKAGKMRSRHLRGEGDGGERQPGGEIRTQVFRPIAGGRSMLSLGAKDSLCAAGGFQAGMVLLGERRIGHGE